MKKNIIIATVLFFAIGGLILYLIIPSKEEKEREYTLEVKKSAYDNYISFIEEVEVVKDVETAIMVIKESEKVLNNLSNYNDLGKSYNEFEVGNEYLDVLRKSAVENLNAAISAIYDTNITLAQIESIYHIRESEHVSESNKSILDTILKGFSETRDIHIGMTKELVEFTKWGAPKDINRTTTANGTSEQWVYDDYKYLYFENGILTTIQE